MSDRYKTGLAGLFSMVAREVSESASVRYVIHRDHANNRWNVYKKTGLFEDYVDSFDELDDAQDFCDINNGVLDAMCTGTDPVRCDDPNCRVHGKGA